MRLPLRLTTCACVSLAFACGGDEGSNHLSVSVCDPANGPFSLTIDHPYLPLAPGTHLVLNGTVDGVDMSEDYLVEEHVEEILGVQTRRIRLEASAGASLTLVSQIFVAQAPDGTVCQFAESPDRYEGGLLVGHRGEWRAGVRDAMPGIFMPADPEVGMTYDQQVAPGDAEDQVEIVEIGKQFRVPNRTFADTLDTLETSTLEPDRHEDKRYARDVGLIVSGALMITDDD
jgi:hypothetical protein